MYEQGVRLPKRLGLTALRLHQAPWAALAPRPIEEACQPLLC